VSQAAFPFLNLTFDVIRLRSELLLHVSLLYATFIAFVFLLQFLLAFRASKEQIACRITGPCGVLEHSRQAFYIFLSVIS
jgi:hypothetical protein